jgi:hypothetical protein
MTRNGINTGVNGMTELNTEKLLEWFIIDVWTTKRNKSDYLVLNCGNVENNEVATIKERIPENIRASTIYRIMQGMGFKDTGTGAINPMKFFVRGFHFFGKPMKIYIGGNPDDFRWTIAIDTITARKQDISFTPEEQETIKRVVSNAPDFKEAMRRMSTTDPVLVFRFGQAVGVGIMTRDGKI